MKVLKLDCEIAPGPFICIWKFSRDLPIDLFRLIKLLWKGWLCHNVTGLSKEIVIKKILSVEHPTLFPEWLGLLGKPHINQTVWRSHKSLFT